MNNFKNRKHFKIGLIIHQLRRSQSLMMKVYQMKVSKVRSRINVTLMKLVNILTMKKVNKTIRRMMNKIHQSMMMKTMTMSPILSKPTLKPKKMKKRTKRKVRPNLESLMMML